MKYYPLMLDLRGRPCVVVGGGNVAERKVLSLVNAAASVTVISPSVTAALRNLAAESRIAWRDRTFADEDLERAFLVIAATDDAALNERAARICRERNILVNVVTSPAASSFLVPSLVERGDLLIAISTSGNSPALARAVRERLESEFGPEYALLLDKLAVLRRDVLDGVRDGAVRKRIFEAVVAPELIELLRTGDPAAADKRIREIVARETGDRRR